MPEVIRFNDKRVELAFNEWMRRFIDNPAQFAREWQDATEFLKEEAAGVEPTYGAACVLYLEKLLAAD